MQGKGRPRGRRNMTAAERKRLYGREREMLVEIDEQVVKVWLKEGQ